MAVNTRPPRVPFLVSYGPEDFFLDRDIERARAWPKREAILLEGEETTESQLISRIEEASYDAPRTIILDNAQKVKLSKIMKGFTEEFAAKSPTNILLAVVRSEKLPAGWAQVADKGERHEAQKFKAWQTEPILRWIDLEATRNDVKIPVEVAKILLRWVDVDLYRLSNEIRKLAIFVGPQGTVTKEHLALVVSKTPGASVFQVAEATIAKTAVIALNHFTILYRNEGPECLVPTASALMKQVERTLIVRRSLDKGVDADIIAASVGLDAKKYPYKQLVQHANKHKVPELIRHMRRLCKLDVEIKGAASSKRTLVELAVLAIAR